MDPIKNDQKPWFKAAGQTGLLFLIALTVLYIAAFFRADKPAKQKTFAALSADVRVPPYDITYKLLQVEKIGSQIEAITSDSGGSLPTNYSKDLFDCDHAVMQNLGEASTLEEALNRSLPGRSKPIIKGSPNDYLATAACNALSASLNRANLQP